MKRLPVWTKLISIAVLIALGMVMLGDTTAVNAQGTAGDGMPRAARVLMTALLNAAEKALGVPQATLRQELGTGKTLADVIKAHGGDVAAIKASAKAAVTDQINKAVADGKLTQDQANKLLAKLDTALDKLINVKWPKNLRTRLLEAQLKAMGLRVLVQETATQSHISQRDLLKESRDGKTLAQIATGHGADPAKTVAAAVTTMTDRINKLVAANRLTQDEAKKLIDGLPAALTQAMNTPRPRGGQPANPPAVTPDAAPAAAPADAG
jgi:polyhydroxyalkanoate synthesis regulator phasin